MNRSKLNKGQLLREAWQRFERQVIPPATSREDRQRAELTFYAGASAVIDVVTRIAEDDVSEDSGVEIFESLHEERRAFAARMTAAAGQVRES